MTTRLGRTAALAAVLAFAALASPARAYDYFFEDFNGPALDPAKWDAAQAVAGMRWCSSTVADHHSAPGEWVDLSTGNCFGWTQSSPYGAVAFGSENGTTVARFSAEYPSVAFPYLAAGPGLPASPFPATGDFALEIKMRYDGLNGHGDGVIATAWANPSPSGNNPPSPSGQGVWGIWGDSSISMPVGVFRTYRLEYVGGVYTSLLDGVVQWTSTSALRPATIWLGNPVITSWGAGPWTPFTVDYVRVSISDLPVDVKPSDCPNTFDVRASGSLPVAIVGTSLLDVSAIEPASIRLNGVQPLSAKVQDVSTPALPFSGKVATDCNVTGPDGRPDLVLKFDGPTIAKSLGAVVNGEARTLKLTASLKSGESVRGEDVVVILK